MREVCAGMQGRRSEAFDSISETDRAGHVVGIARARLEALRQEMLQVRARLWTAIWAEEESADPQAHISSVLERAEKAFRKAGGNDGG